MSTAIRIFRQPHRILLTMLLCSSIVVHAQEPATLEHHDDHDHIHHDHTAEIGLSAGYVYLEHDLEHDKESAAGIGLHLIKRLGDGGMKQYLGMGAGFESIFAEHSHYNVMGAFAMFPYRTLAIVIAPGVLFAKHHEEWEQKYSTHVEISYGFFYSEFEIGPVIGFAQSGDNRHYSLGIHFGKGF